MIEKPIRDAHFSVKMNENTKQQTLEAIKLLKEHMLVECSFMKLRVLFNGIEGIINKLASSVEHEEWNASTLN